jgi:hypothetical protein
MAVAVQLVSLASFNFFITKTQVSVFLLAVPA